MTQISIQDSKWGPKNEQEPSKHPNSTALFWTGLPVTYCCRQTRRPHPKCATMRLTSKNHTGPGEPAFQSIGHVSSLRSGNCSCCLHISHRKTYPMKALRSPSPKSPVLCGRWGTCHLIERWLVTALSLCPCYCVCVFVSLTSLCDFLSLTLRPSCLLITQASLKPLSWQEETHPGTLPTPGIRLDALPERDQRSLVLILMTLEVASLASPGALL